MWADGVYLQARIEPAGRMHARHHWRDARGEKELLGLAAGMREARGAGRNCSSIDSAGLVIAPEITVSDGALGFWKALDNVPSTRHQRTGSHKTLNVLDKLPKAFQSAAHKDLRTSSCRRAARRRDGDGCFRREIRGEISKGRRLPDKRPRRAADVFRFSCRALNAFCEPQIRSKAPLRRCGTEPCARKARFRRTRRG